VSVVLYDVNIWIALAFDKHPHHALATGAFNEADSLSPAAFCRTSQQAFLRLVTTPAIQECYGIREIANEKAWKVWEDLILLPQVGWLDEPPGLQELWGHYGSNRSVAPKVWADAYLAAFAKAYDIEFLTLNDDFRKFEGLSVKLLSAKTIENSE